MSDELRWGRGFGIFLIVYAVLGCTMVTLGAAGTAFGDSLAKMGGMELPPMPPALMWWNLANLVVSVGLAIMLFRGALALVRGQRAAASRLIGWATARIVLAAVGLVVSLALAGVADRYQEDIHNVQREFVLKQTEGKQDPGPYRGSTAESMAKWTGPLVTVAVCIVPVIVAVLVGRQRTEIEQWPEAGFGSQVG